jgi:arsenate reductase-like glutaredoxin family protein
MELQIIGTAKCKETAKVKRFFSDRSINFHLRDINDKHLTKKELSNIARGDFDGLIDHDSKEYKKGGYDHRIYDPEEELLEKPGLLKTPISRSGKGVVVGFDEKELKKLI